MAHHAQPRFAKQIQQSFFGESALTYSTYDGVDSLEQLALADAADRTLLRLVLCAAAATLTLALASGLAA